MIPVSEDGGVPDVCVIELGGTIGDIEGRQDVIHGFSEQLLKFVIQQCNMCMGGTHMLKFNISHDAL